jgi:hypothetical protein
MAVTACLWRKHEQSAPVAVLLAQLVHPVYRGDPTATTATVPHGAAVPIISYRYVVYQTELRWLERKIVPPRRGSAVS